MNPYRNTPRAAESGIRVEIDRNGAFLMVPFHYGGHISWQKVPISPVEAVSLARELDAVPGRLP